MNIGWIYKARAFGSGHLRLIGFDIALPPISLDAGTDVFTCMTSQSRPHGLQDIEPCYSCTLGFGSGTLGRGSPVCMDDLGSGGGFGPGAGWAPLFGPCSSYQVKG